MLFMDQFGKAFVFQRWRPTLKKYLMKAGYDDVPYSFFGGLFYFTLIITFIVYFAVIYAWLAPIHPILLLFATFGFWFGFQGLLIGFIIIIIYIYLNMKIYNRTKKLEMLLPDYLQLVSTNLKGGMSFDRAMWSSIKPEFGILAREVTMVSKRVLTGNDLTEALQEFAHKYDSPILKRSIDLIIGEIESGGRIAQVIDKVIISLRKTALLKEEMTAQTVTYMIFIGSIVMFIAPALFALSSQLIKIIISFSSKIGGQTQGVNMPFDLSQVNINPADFQVFSVIALAIISVFAAMIVSIVEKGDIRGGLKYIPIFLVVSIVCYFLFSIILSSLFGNAIFQ